MKRTALAAVLCLAGLAVLAGRSTAAPASGPIAVKLPKHVWGHFQQPDIRDVNAKWGKGPGQVGFLQAEDGPTGGSSWDVVNGIVRVLDQHNGRVEVFDLRKKPRAIPLTVTGLPGEIFRGVESSLAVGTARSTCSSRWTRSTMSRRSGASRGAAGRRSPRRAPVARRS